MGATRERLRRALHRKCDGPLLRRCACRRRRGCAAGADAPRGPAPAASGLDAPPARLRARGGERAMTGPLSGLRVLDLGTFVAAPFCGTLLAEFGAHVVKVEQPGIGDSL